MVSLAGWQAKLAAGALVAAGAFWGGWTVATWRADAALLTVEKARQIAQEAAQAEAARVTALRQENSLLEQAAAASKRAALQEFDITLQKRITRYVQTPAAAECGLDGGWVRVHNDAARGALSGPAADPAAPGQDPAGASRGDVLEAVTVNYRLYHRLKTDYTELLGHCKSLYTERG